MKEAGVRDDVGDRVVASIERIAPGFGTLVVDREVLGPPDIEARIAARIDAKARRDFAEADRIRDELKAEGVLLEDGPSGTIWRRA